jgi:AcrR family transcriptional regulator
MATSKQNGGRAVKAATGAAEPRPYHKGNVAADLKAAALSLLKTERFEDISARRLCREVGVTYANFYNHFPSFDYLMLDVAADAFMARAAGNRRIIESSSSRRQAMLEITVATVEFAVKTPQLFRLMFGQIESEMGPPRFDEEAGRSLRILGRAAGAQSLDDPNAYAFFAFTQGLARIVSQRFVEESLKTVAARRRFIERVSEAFFAGVPD